MKPHRKAAPAEAAAAGRQEMPRCAPKADSGLSSAQAQALAEAGWDNRPVESPTKSDKQIIRENIFTYFNLIFVVLAVCLLLVGDWKDMTFLLIVAANAVIGIVQQLRSKRTIEKLSLLSAAKVRIIRDGKVRELPVDQLVREDVVELTAGCQIPADGPVLTGQVQVNEALITGEADAVTKEPGDQLLSGSFVISGKCRARMDQVGADSYASKLTLAAKKDDGPGKSEMMRSLDRLIQVVGFALIPVGCILFYRQFHVLGMDFRMNVIGFGAFTKNHKNFWSFDLNVRVNEDANLPYSLFEFIKLGKEGQIRNFGTSTDSYLEAAFSYSFPLMDDRLYIGIRGKFLAGLARALVTYDRFDISLREDRWAVLTQGTLDLTAAGAKVETDPDSETFEIGDLDFKPTKPAGYGFALDLGATYDILPNLQASLAVTDLGFISWSKKNSVMGVSTQETEFTGATVPENASEPVPDFDLEMLKFNQVDGRSTTKMLRASVNAGLEYEVWRHKIGIGLLYTARVWKYKTMHNITGSVNFHPVRWFTVSGSYSVIDNRGGAVGLALNLCPNWINFYLATDVLTSKHTPQWVPIKQSSMNVTLGLGIPIGKRSHRIAAYVREGDRR